MAGTGLTRVIRCPGAVELLDELGTGTRAFTDLRRVVPRRVLEPALRVLAAEGALRRASTGTVDLSDVDVWVEVYERYLKGGPELMSSTWAGLGQVGLLLLAPALLSRRAGGR